MSSRSYTSPKREATAARTRQKLVRSAVGLLKSPDSLKKLSLESVAREAGVSRLTVYNQFGSRKGLLEAVFDDRARLGGIQQLADAMAHPDPHQGLARLIEVFCHFWDFNRQIVTAVLGAAVADPDLRESMLERNERRRGALAVLVRRMQKRPLPDKAAAELVDVLFMLTGFPVFAELAQRGRDTAAACGLIQDLANAAIERGLGLQESTRPGGGRGPG
jgi:AcrR family transcriptional regulator